MFKNQGIIRVIFFSSSAPRVDVFRSFVSSSNTTTRPLDSFDMGAAGLESWFSVLELGMVAFFVLSKMNGLLMGGGLRILWILVATNV